MRYLTLSILALSLGACYAAPPITSHAVTIDTQGNRREIVTTTQVSDDSQRELMNYYLLWPFVSKPSSIRMYTESRGVSAK